MPQPKRTPKNAAFWPLSRAPAPFPRPIAPPWSTPPTPSPVLPRRWLNSPCPTNNCGADLWSAWIPQESSKFRPKSVFAPEAVSACTIELKNDERIEGKLKQVKVDRYPSSQESGRERRNAIRG